MAEKLTYKFIKEQIEKEGYKLLSKIYKNSYTNIKVQCNECHKYKVTWDNFKQGKRCPVCNGGIKYNHNYVKKQIESVKGYKLLSENYKNNHTKLKIQCNKEHVYKASWEKFKIGQRCPICDYTKTTSKAEKEILEIVKQLLPYIIIIENDRTQILNPLTNKNLELDIWIPELNKAIEFNGKYWHSNKYSKYKDEEKIKQCINKNIDLLIIQEQKWLDDKNNCIKQITNWISK